MQTGVSFLGAQYGLPCDNILEHETVVANGSIININTEKYKDLVVAIRGGGDHHRIVTKFTLKVWIINPNLETSKANFCGDISNRNGKYIFADSISISSE
jgi:FAD/FMN-containing dehydrogenase